jgi:Tol biopolymer transport system component
VPWLAGAASTVAAFVLAAVLFRGAPSRERTIRFLVSPPENGAWETNGNDAPAFSPDGETLLFNAVDSNGTQKLWIQPLNSVSAQPIAGTEGAVRPFWSPDSQSVAFFADGRLKIVDPRGGPPRTLCDGPAGFFASGAWSRHGVILFGAEGGAVLSRVAAAGGEVKPATTLDASRQEVGHSWPHFLPDGRHFFYFVTSARSEHTGVYVAALDSLQARRLVDTQYKAVYAVAPAGAGNLFFIRGDTLMAQTFDSKRLELSGEPLPVAEQILRSTSGSRWADFSASDAGVIAYRTGRETERKELIWFDRRGRRLETVGEPDNYSNPALSPDEKKLVVCRANPRTRTRDLWLWDLARKTSSRFTFDAVDKSDPVWSPDGTRIAFDSNRDIYVKAVTGGSEPEAVLKTPEIEIARDWSPDGRFLLVHIGITQIWALPLEGDRKRVGPYPYGIPLKISPNGRWVAYTSSVSGRPEIFVQSYPPSGSKWQISKAGGNEAYWRTDGKELYYIAEDSNLMAVEVKTDAPVFEAGDPKPLFSMRLERTNRNTRYQVAANGQRFLANVPIQTSTSPITVVVNWKPGARR